MRVGVSSKAGRWISSAAVSLGEAQAVFPDITEEQYLAADADGDGSIDESEFVAILRG